MNSSLTEYEKLVFLLEDHFIRLSLPYHQQIDRCVFEERANTRVRGKIM